MNHIAGTKIKIRVQGDPCRRRPTAMKLARPSPGGGMESARQFVGSAWISARRGKWAERPSGKYQSSTAEFRNRREKLQIYLPSLSGKETPRTPVRPNHEFKRNSANG
jgi:hypothetical protein